MLIKNFILLFLLAGPYFQNPGTKVNEPFEVAELNRLELAWNKAHLEGDADVLDRLWSDDLVVIVPNMAVMGKTDSISIWRTGRMKFKRYETSELRTRVYKDMAIVTGRLQRGREINDKAMEDDWQFTKVYL